MPHPHRTRAIAVLVTVLAAVPVGTTIATPRHEAAAAVAGHSAGRVPLAPRVRRVLRAPSDSQAELGRRWFVASCEECHAVDDVSSDDFRLRWNGRTAFDLFELLSTTMPEETPGSLPRRAYVDIIAYLAKLNADSSAAVLPDDDAALAARTLDFSPHHTLWRE